MRRLILLRHAKSSWADEGVHDAARRLNERGRLAAVLMGAWLAEYDLFPDFALISTARRAVETWERAKIGMGMAPPHASAPIYMAEAGTLLEVLQGAPADARTVLMLGHQPGMSDFMEALAGEVAEDCVHAFDKFPTASVAVIEFDGLEAWTDLAPRAGRLVRFAHPKDLV
ncbi:MAG: phosphohistidine phosphatase [Paracoccaceae bacterium]|jgi:phosphohistidine phosphatase